MTKPTRFDTKLIHSGELKPLIAGAINMPIFQTSTYLYEGEGSYDEVRYHRLNNSPNHLAVGAKIAALEGAEAALVTASGMAAITTAIMALVPPGGHIVAQDSLYGGTAHFLTDSFARMGREVSFFPLGSESDLAGLVRPNTAAIYIESLSNPGLQAPDFEAVVKIARQHGVLTIIDNTFPSPVNFNPIALGIDVVVHSATKYLNGHSDVIAGAIAGPRAELDKVTHLLNHLGGCLDAHSLFLLHRGLKTLGLRVRQQNDSAARLARALAAHPKIDRVIYPGLEDHPHHARVKKYFRGFGGMLAFDYAGSVEEIDRMLARLELAFVAPSLGGPETLVTRPATTSHAGVPEDVRRRTGITDTLVRVSVGLEDPEDLIQDFLTALG